MPEKLNWFGGTVFPSGGLANKKVLCNRKECNTSSVATPVRVFSASLSPLSGASSASEHSPSQSVLARTKLLPWRPSELCSEPSPSQLRHDASPSLGSCARLKKSAKSGKMRQTQEKFSKSRQNQEKTGENINKTR